MHPRRGHSGGGALPTIEAGAYRTSMQNAITHTSDLIIDEYTNVLRIKANDC